MSYDSLVKTSLVLRHGEVQTRGVKRFITQVLPPFGGCQFPWQNRAGEVAQQLIRHPWAQPRGLVRACSAYTAAIGREGHGV